jgi:hypothetical protein
MPGIPRDVAEHSLDIRAGARPVKQPLRRFDEENRRAIGEEIHKLMAAGFIKEVFHPEWLANPVLVKKRCGKWRMCVDYTGLNKACPKVPYPLPCIDQIMDSTAGCETLSFLDAYPGYHQIRMKESDHFRPDQRVKGRTTMQAACNRTKGAHPFDFDAPSMEAQAHTSCNRRAGYYVRKTAPPLAPVPRLLDCGTGVATRGNPAHGPTVPTRRIGHGSVRHGRRRDGRYGQKWAGSDGGGRRAEAAVKSSASSRLLLGQRENPLPRREDDAPVFRSSNGPRTQNGCSANHSSRCINSTAGQAAPLAGEAGDASPPP